ANAIGTIFPRLPTRLERRVAVAVAIAVDQRCTRCETGLNLLIHSDNHTPGRLELLADGTKARIRSLFPASGPVVQGARRARGHDRATRLPLHLARRSLLESRRARRRHS